MRDKSRERPGPSENQAKSFSARWIWISVHLIYGDPRDLFVWYIRFPQIYFVESELLGIELSWY